jgi:hypothetical protein
MATETRVKMDVVTQGQGLPPEAGTDLLVLDPTGRTGCLGRSSTLHVLRLNEPQPPGVSLVCGGTVRCIAFDGTGARLLSGDDSKNVRLWDPAAQTCVATWPHNKKIACVEFSPDGQQVLYADRFGEVYLAPLHGGQAPTIALGHLSPLSVMRFNPGATRLLTADREGHVRCSCWPDADVIDCYFLGHTTPVHLVQPLAFAPLLITAASSGSQVCVWRFADGTLLHQLAAEELWQSVAPQAGGEAQDAALLDAACDCSPQPLVALAFRGRTSVHFVAPSCAPGAAASALLCPAPQLTLQLPLAPAVLSCTTAGVLCALTADALCMFAPAADGRGFSAAGSLSLASLPAAQPLPADHDDGADGDD